jgi:hypothetical protein
MSTHTEHKMGILFAEALTLHAGLEVTLGNVIVSEHGRCVEAFIGIHDLNDWALRRKVLEVATAFGLERDFTVLCFFRSLDDLAELVTH